MKIGHLLESQVRDLETLRAIRSVGDLPPGC